MERLPSERLEAAESMLNDVAARVLKEETLESGQSAASSTSTTQASSVATAFVYLPSPVVIATTPDGLKAWTAYDASGSVPAGAQVAILEASLREDNNGAVRDQRFNIRKDSNSPSLKLLWVRTGTDENHHPCAQGFFPLSSWRTLEWELTASDGVAPDEYEFRLIGYVK